MKKMPVRRFQLRYFVYIVASLTGTLYVGLTDNLCKRICEHKAGTFDGFTRRYKVNRLMYFETYSDPKRAELREKQVKKYRREKKVAFFAESNPDWKDLTPEIHVTIGIPHPQNARVRDLKQK
jgi:putative endonuclease